MTAVSSLISEVPKTPRLYLACPLTNLSAVTRQSLSATVDSIQLRIEQLTLHHRIAGDKWPIAVYAPLKQSAPWKQDGLSPSAVYEGNLTQVLDSDGLIVLACRTASAGVGQEIEWAVKASLPILYLTPGAEVSRQIRGTPGRLLVADYGSDMETLGLRLDTWLRANRTLIEDGPRRRSDRRLRYMGMTLRLREAWKRTSDPTSAAARCNLHPSLVDSLLSDPARVALMPSEWLDRLSAELGVPKPLTGPQLGIRALRAWLKVTDARKLDDAGAERLRLFALADLLRNPKLDLDTPSAWQRLADRVDA